jgi:hypothetical protein
MTALGSCVLGEACRVNISGPGLASTQTLFVAGEAVSFDVLEDQTEQTPSRRYIGSAFACMYVCVGVSVYVCDCVCVVFCITFTCTHHTSLTSHADEPSLQTIPSSMATTPHCRSRSRLWM